MIREAFLRTLAKLEETKKPIVLGWSLVDILSILTEFDIFHLVVFMCRWTSWIWEKFRAFTNRTAGLASELANHLYSQQ